MAINSRTRLPRYARNDTVHEGDVIRGSRSVVSAESETVEDVLIARIEFLADGGAAKFGNVIGTASADDSLGTVFGAGRIIYRAGHIISIPVLAPFQDIAVHIV